MGADEHGKVWSKLDDRRYRMAAQQIDWMSAYDMHGHVARLTGGRSWMEHARDKHLMPLLERKRRTDPDCSGLSVLSIGCGNAIVERELFAQSWPISRLHCTEYVESLLESAAANLSGVSCEKRFSYFDMNHPEGLDEDDYDVVWFCHSIHHCSEVETFLPYMNRLVKDEGLIMGCDYFGPSRLQVEPDVLAIINEIFALLPDHLRFNLSTKTVETKFSLASAREVASYDMSEAPRSRDIRSLLFSGFPVLEVLPMGGTLLRPLITHRAANFRTETDTALLRVLQLLERILIQRGVVLSDDLFFVCGKSDRM